MHVFNIRSFRYNLKILYSYEQVLQIFESNNQTRHSSITICLHHPMKSVYDCLSPQNDRTFIVNIKHVCFSNETTSRDGKTLLSPNFAHKQGICRLKKSKRIPSGKCETFSGVPRKVECVPFIIESVPTKVRTHSGLKGTLFFLKKRAFTFLERQRMYHIFHWGQGRKSFDLKLCPYQVLNQSNLPTKFRTKYYSDMNLFA